MDKTVLQYEINRTQVFHFQCRHCKSFYYLSMAKMYNERGIVVNYCYTFRDGKTYDLSNLLKKARCCNTTLQSRSVRGTRELSEECGKHCFDSRTRDCRCKCGGSLHGVTYAGNLIKLMSELE